MFKTRLLSGIVLVAIALFTIITGENVLFATVIILSFIGMWELYRIFDVQKQILGITGYIAAAGYYALIYFKLLDNVMMVMLSFLMLLMAVYVFSFPKYRSEQIVTVFFGLFYVAVMLSYIYQTRMLTNGVFIVWLIFICSWGCDTCAYCVGVLIGKHKMSPKLSPKKSIEGAVGGLVGASLIGAGYGYVVSRYIDMDVNIVAGFAIISAVGGLISMVGDLAASAIKRNHEIKDYGTLIPGHGGILDRFDSVIFTAPCIYYLALFMF